jgi:hypothetical protein
VIAVGLLQQEKSGNGKTAEYHFWNMSQLAKITEIEAHFI